MTRERDAWGEGGFVAAANDKSPVVPAIVERFVRQLLVANKAVQLYPPSSTIPRETSDDAITILREAFQERSDIRFVVTKTGLFYESAPVFPNQSAFVAFAQELYNRRLSEVRFHAGIEGRDLISFLSVLKYTPDEVLSAGGFEARLWEQNVDTITVTEAQISLVDVEAALSPGAEAAAPAYTRSQMDDIVSAAYGGRNRDGLIIARILGTPGAVRDYLADTYEGVDGVHDLMAVGDRFAELAHIALEIGGEEQHELMRSLAEELWALDPQLRRDLLVEQVLPEARTSEPLAAVVRQMDIDEVCRMFVHDLDTGDASREGLVRAIRNLALISMADRDEVVNAAGAAMLGAGLGDSVVAEVLEMAAPSRLTVLPSSGSQQERPVDAIFKLMDLAPAMQVSTATDPDLIALKDEARRGITDGDVISALVALVGMDARELQFASTMAMLEDALDLLIARGEIDVAADAAASMRSAAENPALSPEQCLRLERAVARFARPQDVRAIVHTLRLYKLGTPEHDAARRLLDTLGLLAIQPLLEHLAIEPDMAARKSLVDMLSGIATRYISELGAYMTDPRWYFVRNVVSILSATKSSAVLPYLERTLRHSETRVRRETIRGLAGITDRRASEMLMAVFADEDAQNVQLAARYLGGSGVRAAIPSLEQVARGEGRGNRENGPRVEAIEALGRLGALEAMPTLEALAGKRAIIGAARARELRAAAESAIAQIRLHQGGSR